MFGIPIDKIDSSDVDAFCGSGAREGVLLDFKKDFPAKLDKTIAAFANTFGGMILIGVDETPTGEPIIPICGVPLVSGLRERVIQIGLNAIYPPVIPDVKVVDFKSRTNLSASDRAVVVVRVHESDIGSHAVDNRTAVYLRVENISDPYRRATIDELEWFVNKRAKALQEKNRIRDLAQQHAQQYLIRLRTLRQMATSEPSARCTFWTVPRFPRQPIASPQELMTICGGLRWQLPLHYHLFPLGSICPVTEGVLFDGDYRSDYRYTEIQQQGLVYHEYGFWWDTDADKRNLVLPENIAELMVAGLRYGTRLYEKTGYWGLVEFEFSLVGIRGRKFSNPTRFSEFSDGYGAVDDHITVRAADSVPALIANGIEIAKRLMTDIAWAFGMQVDSATVTKYCAGLNM